MEFFNSKFNKNVIDEVEFANIEFKLKDVEKDDKIIVEEVLKVMSVIQYPDLKPQKTHIENENFSYKIICEFPAYTIFRAREHFDVIKFINPYRIEEIWSEPTLNSTLFVSRIKKSNSKITNLVSHVVMLKITSCGKENPIHEFIQGPQPVFDDKGEFLNQQNSKKRKL